MGFNIGPRVLRSTGGGIKRVGNHRIHHFPPEHITDGLVLHLDAADRNSLDPQQGITAWNNLAPGGKFATTLYNGASYEHGLGGTVYMNPGSSVNDYANIIADGKLLEGSFTIDLWMRWTDIRSGNYTNIWSTDGYNNGTTGFALYTFGAETRVWGHPRADAGNEMMIQTTGTWANNIWYNMVLTRDIGTKKMKLYKNGVVIGTATNITTNWETHNTNNDYSLGTRDGSGYPFDGYFSIVKGYKRALSDAEVVQNYEADKLRHQVTYSTTFSPTCSGSGGKVDVLCVAGGGGGGIQHGGGGGAGGYLETTGLAIVSGGTYTAAVGAGGTGSYNASSFGGAKGVNGGNSVFSGTSITTMTSVGGGGGSSMYSGNQSGNGGGSGGGCALDQTGGSGTKAGGSGTSGQGFAGGNTIGYSGTNYGGGSGGGGAGGVGQPSHNGSTFIAGAGGPGKTSSISGTPVTYAGGGGGGSHAPFIYGAGGSGGGGRGGLGNSTGTANGHNGVNGLGGGGGGCGAYTNDGGSGGHGTIIVRYPAEDYNVEMLIVGGGGGGGKSGDAGSDPAGGGGGAGGLIYYSSYKITSGKNYITYVGPGGAGRASYTLNGDTGSSSVFGNITAFGGGGGGAGSKAGSGGGSAGGGGGNSGTKGLATSSGQGNDGGTPTTYGGGGGGGAGAVGGDGLASSAGGGDGGAGLAYSINGTSTTYAGGGGGGARNAGSAQAGAGGSGGGGAGQVTAAGNAGTDGLGGGGGGTSTGSQGGNGGQGTVIIAYKGPQRGEGGTVSMTSRPGYTVHTFTVAGPNRFIG
tara:strand:+ start:30 stop:2429 length:2400 start_codon:yes stop_codon:yes gene_type:complete